MQLNIVQPASQEVPIITYDFTVWPEYEGITGCSGITGHFTEQAYQLSKKLRTFCRAFCFQLEIAPTTGRLHFQGRLKLKEKKRKTQFISFFGDQVTKICHISPTAKENSKNFFYVMKESTKLLGPWADTDNGGKEMPWHLAMFPDLLAWQETIKRLIQIRELRILNCVINGVGNNGKTICCQKLVWEGLACYLPFSDSHKELMQAVLDCGDKPAFIFDFPRALKKSQMRPLFSAIEDIKSGWSFNHKYGYRSDLRGQPNIWLFMNKWPNIRYLSADRWKFWNITDSKELVQYTPEEIDAAQKALSAKAYAKKHPGQKYRRAKEPAILNVPPITIATMATEAIKVPSIPTPPLRELPMTPRRHSLLNGLPLPPIGERVI